MDQGLGPPEEMAALWRPERAEVSGSGGVWPLYVGLFLALLTFFIVLVGLSPPEARRTSAVIDSVQAAFAAPPPAPAPDALFAAGRASLAELGGDLAGLVRVARVVKNGRGDEMRVRLAAGEIFVDGTADLRAEITDLLDRIVAASSSPPAGFRLHVSLALGRPQASAAERAGRDAGDPSLAIARVGVLARDLIARGAPPAVIAIALDPGPPDRATIAFRLVAEARAPGATGARSMLP